MSYQFAQRVERVRSSTVMELLRLAGQPGLISFAGGLPAPKLFPVAEIRAATDRVLDSQAATALQYGETEGYRPLRELVVGEMASRGIDCRVEDTLITSGSQQALDLVARIFLDDGDCVLTENPTYLAAIQVFQSYGARFAPVPTDDDGLIPAALPGLIARHRPKLLYTIANFQNPTGRTLTLERRRELVEVASRHGLLVVEDDPYGKLRYRGADVPPIRSLDSTGQVIYLSTFSKTVAPGLRTGYVIAPEAVQRRLIVGLGGWGPCFSPTSPCWRRTGTRPAYPLLGTSCAGPLRRARRGAPRRLARRDRAGGLVATGGLGDAAGDRVGRGRALRDLRRPGARGATAGGASRVLPRAGLRRGGRGEALSNLAMYLTLQEVPQLLSAVGHRPSEEIGAVLASLSGPMAVLGPVSGRLADLWGVGAWRWWAQG